MNLHKISSMVKNGENWEDIHMQIFFYLCKFYCENTEKKEAFDFINKMNKISQEDALGIRKHTVDEHMQIYGDLIEFYRNNADPVEFEKLKRIAFQCRYA